MLWPLLTAEHVDVPTVFYAYYFKCDYLCSSNAPSTLYSSFHKHFPLLLGMFHSRSIVFYDTNATVDLFLMILLINFYSILFCFVLFCSILYYIREALYSLYLWDTPGLLPRMLYLTTSSLYTVWPRTRLYVPGAYCYDSVTHCHIHCPSPPPWSCLHVSTFLETWMVDGAGPGCANFLETIPVHIYVPANNHPSTTQLATVSFLQLYMHVSIAINAGACMALPPSRHVSAGVSVFFFDTKRS